MFCADRLSFCAVAFVIIAATLPTYNDAARILGYFPVVSKSNMIIHCSIAETLAKAGHDVTVLGNIANVNPNASYTYIHVDVPPIDGKYITETVNDPQPIYKRFGGLLSQVLHVNDAFQAHQTTQKFLREHGANSFDLVIFGYFINDFLLGVAGHFRCPVVVSCTVQPVFIVNQMVGNPSEVAYVPTLLGGQRQPMDFWARVKNMLSYNFEVYVLGNILRWQTNKLYDRHFPAAHYPPLDAAKKNISLVFVNHHFSQGPIRPMVPNLIEIGGIQIKETPQPLPTDISNVLKSATRGVIFFSLGSIVQGTHLSAANAKIMFNVLSKLPYKVIWKWGDSDFPGRSENIIYKSWLPQDDILAHPNVKLFITHGGMGSVVESQYHGVPMVGIPLFGDQPANMANVVRAGFGVSVDFGTLTEESFSQAIEEVLHNPKYTETVQRFANLYRDRPLTPRQLVVYWVDYLLRYNGAWHLQSPALHLNSLQLLSLDVIAFLLCVGGGLLTVLVMICRCLCCSKSKRGGQTGVNSSAAKKAKKNK